MTGPVQSEPPVSLASPRSALPITAGFLLSRNLWRGVDQPSLEQSPSRLAANQTPLTRHALSDRPIYCISQSEVLRSSRGVLSRLGIPGSQDQRIFWCRTSDVGTCLEQLSDRCMLCIEVLALISSTNLGLDGLV